MSTTKKYLDYDGLVAYTAKVKKAINDASYTHGVTDIEGTPSASAPSIASDLNATNNARSGNFTVNGSSDTFAYYDTTYGDASTTKDGLMTHEDKTKLDGIATGAQVNVQSDWNQTTTTADDYIKNKPAVNKVKQTAKSDNASYNILMTDIATSGTDDELEYTAQIAHNPSTRSTTFHTTVSSSTVDVKIENGGISMGTSGSINATNYTGTAAQATADAAGNTISTTYAKLNDLAADTGDTDGASLVGYSGTTVADALDDLYDTIGGSGGSSVMDLIEDLQDGENLIQGTNVTLTKDTTNHTVTIAATDEKVKQNKKSVNTNYYVLLSTDDSNGNTITGEANFAGMFKFNPSSKKLMLTSSYTEGTGALATTYETQIDLGESGLSIQKKQMGTTLATGTLTALEYSGNAATATKATQDGSGNNIVNTYATKSALDALSNKWTGQFKIATSAEATAIAGGDASGLELGYIYLVADATASSPNVYDEYIKVALGTTPETYSVEKIGTTDAGVDVVSLTTSEINTIWSTTAAAS